ncbi:hypothetical protein MJ923_14810 [Shewanella sp. 3B26]|uniref:Uncharacterized protein n=1 Tax=Shewanella zhuhaiensis TaxID=2919576 RepID=A0AAJ1BKN3_9GAMM|nr:hypothetical protein [Shewanella zhuhaiensis]MCH4295577.1 hypothetical protein [Shewanella zhuhaiensis]
MERKFSWKRVFMVAVPGAMLVTLVGYFFIPSYGCVDKREDLKLLFAERASQRLAQGNTKPLTVDIHYLEDTEQWCYVEVKDSTNP